MSGRRRANRHRVAAVLFVACGCYSRFETISVNVAEKVDEKMRDRVSDEVIGENLNRAGWSWA
jgi:hypothetical protein